MIRLDNLKLKLGTFGLGVNLTVEKGEYFIILGPNGAGKTVLLETIAGFHKPDEGTIQVNGADVTLLPPEKRMCSLVYQDNALFPHLSVYENVIYGLRAKKLGSDLISDRLQTTAQLTDIEDLLDRKPESLSGGEKRRVSLARALIVTPDVLLLDEPLTALDTETRDRMILELKSIQQHFGITVMHVCHDFSEALSLGDRLAVLDGGQVRQTGSPADIFRRPGSEFVARFTMAKNIFKGETGQNAEGNPVFLSDGLEIVIGEIQPGAGFAAIRPENIVLSKEPVQGPNCFPGEIQGIIDKGNVIDVAVNLPQQVICQASRAQKDAGLLEPGGTIYVSFSPENVSTFSE